MQAAAALWICIALFFVRVVGQVEVLLLDPAWLPPMSAWYSGLLPYPVLLPVQIALLMFMCAIAVRGLKPSSARAEMWRALALIYFALMLVRLIWCVRQFGHDFYLHGGIPIAFHWVLALFLLVWARHRVARVPVFRYVR